jgi:RNA polymerase sigma-70 factor (ECF subfamily)
MAFAKETPNLDTTNQSPEYLLKKKNLKKLQNAIVLTEEVFNESYLKKYREIAELLDISQKAVEKNVGST